MTDSGKSSNADATAIIGMAGRFPGATDIASFWWNLVNGVDSITNLSDERLKTMGIRPELLSDSSYVKAGPFLDGIELFDAQLFNCPPREAELMDPQHRLLLECASEALENAGYGGNHSSQRI